MMPMLMQRCHDANCRDLGHHLARTRCGSIVADNGQADDDDDDHDDHDDDASDSASDSDDTNSDASNAEDDIEIADGVDYRDDDDDDEIKEIDRKKQEEEDKDEDTRQEVLTDSQHQRKQQVDQCTTTTTTTTTPKADRVNLRMLDYYLTFIHYFGFSINPNDDTNSRNLSIRVRRVAAFASSMRRQRQRHHHDRHHHGHHHHRQQQQQQQQRRRTCSWINTSSSIHASPPNLDREPELDTTQIAQGAGARAGTSGGGVGVSDSGKRFSIAHGKDDDADKPAFVRYGQREARTAKAATTTTTTTTASSSKAARNSRKILASAARALRLTVKFLAISLTSFLTLNHVLVLIDYIRASSKAFPELLLELRLVLTKLSALIFVISWHRNQSKVRQLIRLVKSTSVNILAREHASIGRPPAPGDVREFGRNMIAAAAAAAAGDHHHHHHQQQQQQQVDNDNSERWQQQQQQQQQQSEFEREKVQTSRLKALDRRILAWWLLCTSITMIHFSLSEAEIKTAHHLWEWLDDYSLHTLSNATTSETTLFLMASFDNYIYTVHVYGTRLIGSSIICIVCTFQLENINCLTRQAVSSLRASISQHSQHGNDNSERHYKCCSWRWPTIWGSLEEGARSCAAANCLKLDLMQQRHLCAAFYVLGESDWRQVELKRRQLPAQGWLSSSLGKVWRASVSSRLQSLDKFCRRVTISAARALLARANRVTPFARLPRLLSTTLACGAARQRRCSSSHENLQSSSQSGNAKKCFRFAENIDSHESVRKGCPPQPQPRTLKQCSNSSSSSAFGASTDLRATAAQQQHQRLGSLLRDYLNDYLARERRQRRRLQRLALKKEGARADDDDDDDDEKEEDEEEDVYDYDNADSSMTTNNSGHKIELLLDNLARKYELIRTVNLRIERCFGHILLGQYLFLFLMSCIDVVFFSLSFSTNTKTKYIIVSGTILLWLPYLLLYRYASDIGLASERLLTSVRRLARLSLVLELSEQCDNSSAQVSTQQQQQQQQQQQTSMAPFNEAQVTRNTSQKQQRTQSDLMAALCQTSPQPRPLVSERALFWQKSTLWHYRHLFCRRLAWQLELENRLAARDHHQHGTQSKVRSNQQAAAAFPHQHDAVDVVAAACNPHIATQRQQHATAAANSLRTTTSRARIFNKLDHVFEPSNLTIVGIMTMNKFFLLNFAKIVITASVMTIQFITKR